MKSREYRMSEVGVDMIGLGDGPDLGERMRRGVRDRRENEEGKEEKVG